MSDGSGDMEVVGRANVRRRQQDDIAACVQLLASVHATDGYPMRWPEDPARWLTPDNLLAAWVAEREHALLGHIALCGVEGGAAASGLSQAPGLPAEGMAEVARLFVAPTARGLGLGAALLTVASEAARSRSLRPVLKVLDRDRHAMALYDRMGWRHVASVTPHWAIASGLDMRLHYYVLPD